MQLSLVTLAALLTALATGLGALPLLALRRRRDRERLTEEAEHRFLGPANSLAAGAMLAASAALAYEGGQDGLGLTALGLVLGALFMVGAGRLLAGRDVELGQLRGIHARRALTIVVVMTVHSVSEGVGIGVSYGDGATLGLLITLAIAVHNVPEGLAISLVLVPRGASVKQAAAWSVFSSLPQPLMAVPAFLFVETFKEGLPLGLGFAAGAMAWMVARELLPEARDEVGWRATSAWSGAAFVSMLALQVAFLG